MIQRESRTEQAEQGGTGPQERPFLIALPEPGLSMSQDQEWCLVRIEDEWREIRFHDYGDLYRIEGLYEHLFYNTLGCNSPATICGLLRDQLDVAGVGPENLRALDLGAGNGMVGEELSGIGVREVVGVDIVEDAAHAAQRDRPGVYEDYLVADMTRLEPPEREALRARRFNCLTCVAALGFGDIPTEAFNAALGLVEPGGWIAFNIKDKFLTDEESGFSKLIRDLIEQGRLDVQAQTRYVHRFGTDGSPLHYVAMVGRKRAEPSVH